MAASNSLDITQVSINGSKDDAKETKQQRLEWSPEKSRSNFSAEVRAKVEHLKFLIGRNGANIKKIKESTGARIIFPTEEDEDKELIKIIGNQNAVDEAKAELESAIEKILYSQFKFISEEINIEPKYHGYFLARRGAVLHQIIKNSGEVQIAFPHTIIDGDCVIIKGNPESVKAAKQRILEIVQDLRSMVTITCGIPRKHRHVVMGPKGCKVQAIRAEFNVCIKFPERFPQEKWRSDEWGKDEEVEVVDIVFVNDVVQITGQPDDAEAARQALLSLVPITIKVAVPNDRHGSIIGKGGRDVKELMQKYDVQIVFPGTEQNLDYIMITGIQDQVQEAKEVILEKLKHNIEKYSEMKIKLDSEYHPKIIGRSGDVITTIMSDNNVAIYFPCIGDPEDNIITIIGSKKNVHNAHDDLMKIINEVVDQENSVVLGRVLETQYMQSEISTCESPDLSIYTDITEEEERTLDMRDSRKEFTDVDDLIEILHPTKEVEEVQTINVSCKSMPFMDKYTEAIPSELDNNVILKQEEIIKELRVYINDQDLTNKALKVERTKLILEIDSERQECERIIRENKDNCDKETAKMLNTIKDLEANLKIEREEKSMLAAESNEISLKFQDLLSKYQILQENMESLGNAEKGSKSTHGAVISSEDFELANSREITNKLDEVISNNESSNTLAERVEDIDRLKTIIENKEDEISKLKIDLSDALENKIELSKIIQSLNDELVAAEERICGAETPSKNNGHELDEHGVPERENHAAKLQEITSNVYDLKEELIQITQIFQSSHKSSEICEIFDKTE